MITRRQSIQMVVASGAAVWPGLAPAQGRKYPDRPIKFVVPFAAGGGGDTVARFLAQRLSERVAQPVVVENRVGAGGSVGADFVLKSAPDGYTLLNMSSTYPIQAAVTKLPYDPIADMQPVAMISRDPVVLVVGSKSPFKNLAALIAAAQKEPGKLSYGSAGVGSIAHLGMEELAFIMGVKLIHVPYHLADLPTFAEQGIADYNVVDWKALAGPKGMPADVVALLNSEINAILRERTTATKFEADGTKLVGGSPEQMMDIIRADIQRWRRVVEKAKIKVE